MGATFINLTNEVLRRLNEVEIAEADFTNARGVQQLAKDAVKSSIAYINQSEFEWPFNAASHTEHLVPGQTEYTWPSSFKIADYASFQIQANPALNTSYQGLRWIERDQWYQSHRDADYNAGNKGRGIPRYVFAAHGSGFGVTPSPDKAYSLRYRYYINYADLQLAQDETRVPEGFSSVIVNGALYEMYMFKDNPESANLSRATFELGLKALQNLYVNNSEYVYDTRVNYGGNGFYRGFR